MNRRAFTLIELLVVAAIVAAISAVVIFVVNPTETLRKGRDTVRLLDLKNMNNALLAYSQSIGGSMGSSSVTYVSIPDPTATSSAGTDCSGLGFPFTGGGAFHCAGKSTYRNADGTGWIPLNLAKAPYDSFSALPIDPVNTTSSNEYYSYQTDGSTYKITALPESQTYTAAAGTNAILFTKGTNLVLGGGTWVLVPGNSMFDTNNFYVMKYDAACTQSGVALAAPVGASHTYIDNNSGANNCIPANGLAPAALPNAIPIASVSQASSALYCANIGAHLITNNEWQTIAWNAEAIASNWSGGVVGSGTIYSGHNDNAPMQASVASADDTLGYSGTDGPASGGGTGAGGVGAQNQLRTLTLSDGSVVWDMAGNVWQWTNDTILGKNQPTNASPGFAYREFIAITTYGTMTQQTAGPANIAWNSAQGVGQIYSDGTASNNSTYGFMRGGEYAGGSVNGLEALALSNVSSTFNDQNAFRCAR